MSTLNVATIQSLNANTPPVINDSNGVQVGTLCRAWVNFNGTGTIGANQSIRGSFNVSSVFKNATGDYTVFFSNSMPDANYTVAGCGMEVNGQQSASTYQSAVSLKGTSSFLAGSVGILNANIDVNNNVDGTYITIAVFR